MAGVNFLVVAMTMLRFTMPTHDTDLINCVEGTTPMQDVAWVRLMGRELGGTRDTILASRAVSLADAGRAESLSFNPGTKAWTIWAVVVDTSGHTSCSSGILGVGLPAEAPAVTPGLSVQSFRNPVHGAPQLQVSAPGAASVRIVDVAGRVVDSMRLARAGETTWHPRHLPRGLYFVMVRSGGAQATTTFTLLD